MVSADQTQVLREGYWASYNVPFYEQVFKLSGYADMVKKYGQDLSHDLAPRAKIFRRDQGKVRQLYNNASNSWADPEFGKRGCILLKI